MAHFLFVLCLLSNVLALRHPQPGLDRRRHTAGRAQPFAQLDQSLYGRSENGTEAPQEKQSGPPLVVQNEKTKKFAVNGKAIPDVNFDIGESYAGLLPISNKPNEKKQYYFWYFPTSNPDGKEDITIWLNGGPGCSSLEGLLQENGPFLWQYGTFRPVRNPWTWVNLTNMVWVEQPVGTGFTQGESTETTQEQVAEAFLGFWKNFIDTFDLKNKRVYITGESYAGMYVPYIADAMFNAGDKAYHDVQGTMIYDPSINSDLLLQQIPVVPFVEGLNDLFRLNASTMTDLRERAGKCGFKDFMAKYMTFPPKRAMPDLPTKMAMFSDECRLWERVKEAVTSINPCFDIYSVSTTCPVLWDVLGFPGSFDYVPEGASIYFNRSDVQKAINAPRQDWIECSDNVALKKDSSLPSGLTVLPSVIDRSKRTIIAHADLDYVLLWEGTLLAIQNMTWGGKLGFQKTPTEDLFIPYHDERAPGTLAGSGVMGVTHTERKLTWNRIFLAGHMVPQYVPTVAYRQLEFLLGRIPSLTEYTPFTTKKNVPQPPRGGWPKQGPLPPMQFPGQEMQLTQEQVFQKLTG